MHQSLVMKSVSSSTLTPLRAINKLFIIANSSENLMLITKSNQNKESLKPIKFSFVTVKGEGFQL
jgi:hypothetical protein